MQNLTELLKKSKNIAILGATQNKEKYGYKITKNLLNKGYKIFPINPNYETILNTKCYKILSDINESIDILSFVVPPKISEKILENNFPKDKIRNVWFQQGSESDRAIKLAKQLGYDPIYGVCIMLESDKT